MSVSASKSALLLSPCLRWAGPGAREFKDEFASTEKRDKGVLFHAAMDRYFTDGEKWLKVCAHNQEVTGWVRNAIAWHETHLDGRCSFIQSEVYVASNFSTGEVHVDGKVRDRKYPPMEGFLPGTADLVCVLHTGELLVADWKTGGSHGADAQLLTLACGLRKVLTKTDGSARDVLLSVLYAGQQAGEEGCLPHEWPVTDADLQAHADGMAFQLADVGVRNDAAPGSHCTQLYCPHLAYCPGITEFVEVLGKEGLARGKV